MSVVAEPRSTTGRAVFEALGLLFRYPDRLLPATVGTACPLVAECDGAAAAALNAFAAEIANLDPAALQSIYTSTFDLAPSCSPYLGTHVFPEDDGGRVRLLVGLRGCIRDGGGDAGSSELPDHVTEVLRFASLYGEEEWTDLGALVILPALSKMDELLAPTGNPYRHLVAAARRVAFTTFPEGGRE